VLVSQIFIYGALEITLKEWCVMNIYRFVPEVDVGDIVPAKAREMTRGSIKSIVPNSVELPKKFYGYVAQNAPVGKIITIYKKGLLEMPPLEIFSAKIVRKEQYHGGKITVYTVEKTNEKPTKIGVLLTEELDFSLVSPLGFEYEYVPLKEAAEKSLVSHAHFIRPRNRGELPRVVIKPPFTDGNIAIEISPSTIKTREFRENAPNNVYTDAIRWFSEYERELISSIQAAVEENFWDVICGGRKPLDVFRGICIYCDRYEKSVFAEVFVSKLFKVENKKGNKNSQRSESTALKTTE